MGRYTLVRSLIDMVESEPYSKGNSESTEGCKGKLTPKPS